MPVESGSPRSRVLSPNTDAMRPLASYTRTSSGVSDVSTTWLQRGYFCMDLLTVACTVVNSRMARVRYTPALSAADVPSGASSLDEPIAGSLRSTRIETVKGAEALR